MAVQEFPRHNAAELLDLVDIAIDCLLENFVDNFEVAGEVCTLEAAGKIHVHIKVRDKNYRPFLVTVDFNEFFYVFNADPGEVDTDIRRCCLDVRQLLAE
jgi:hypothetical protein